jgi:hypothetical protein
MKKITIALLILTLTGCTHYYYAPNAANIPAFKEKNTFKLNAGYSSGETVQGADIQLAYSVSPKVGIMVNSFFTGSKDNQTDFYGLSYLFGQSYYNGSNSGTESGRGSYIEGAIGYYKPVDIKKLWVFETYAGAGVGGENHVYLQLQKAKLSVTKLFLQPSFSYASAKGTLEVGVSSRFSYLNLKVNRNTLSADDNNWKYLDDVIAHPSSLIWEPAIKISAGGKVFKAYLETTFSSNLNNRFLLQEHDNINLGIQITIGKDKQKEKKEGQN